MSILSDYNKAITSKDYELLEYCMEAGCPINYENECGITPLIHAVVEGKIMLARRMIEKYKANIDHETKYGATAMYWAAATGRIDMME